MLPKFAEFHLRVLHGSALSVGASENRGENSTVS